MRAITRRQFLSSLMPFRLTANRMALGVRMAAVCGAVALLLSLLKNVSFAASAHVALVTTLLFVGLCCLGGVLVWVDSVVRRLPRAVSAAMTTAVELVEFISVMG